MVLRVTLCLAFLALWVAPLRASENPDLPPLLEEAAAAEAKRDLPRAIVLYQQAERLRPDDASLLQRISRLLSDSINDEREPARRVALAAEALDYAIRAVARAPENADCAVSVAVCYGKLALLSETGKKIEYTRRVKEYADRALELDPRSAWAHHVLGRWNYELAQVGGPSRALARVFYGAVPRGSCAEAVRHFRLAVEIAPENVSHQLELGMALVACGDRAEALHRLREALALPTRDRHDEATQARARAMLERLTGPGVTGGNS